MNIILKSRNDENEFSFRIRTIKFSQTKFFDKFFVKITSIITYSFISWFQLKTLNYVKNSIRMWYLQFLHNFINKMICFTNFIRNKIIIQLHDFYKNVRHDVQFFKSKIDDMKLLIVRYWWTWIKIKKSKTKKNEKMIWFWR